MKRTILMGDVLNVIWITMDLETSLQFGKYGWKSLAAINRNNDAIDNWYMQQF